MKLRFWQHDSAHSTYPIADSSDLWDTQDVGLDEALQSSNDFLQTIEIDDRTPLDRAVLVAILGLQIQTAHTLIELHRKVTEMTVDTSALDTAVQSAIALLEQLAANNTDATTQAAVDADVAALNNAVATNTPAAPVEPPAV